MRLARIYFFIAAVVMTGCGDSNDGRLPTAPVEVTVNYKGKPISDAIVTFMSSGVGAEAGKPPGFGRTNAEGKVKLTTYEQDDGAVLGKHIVMIAKQEFTNSKQVASQDSAEYNPGASPLPQVKHLLPAKYSLPGSTGLSAEVAKGKINSFTFDLND